MGGFERLDREEIDVEHGSNLFRERSLGIFDYLGSHTETKTEDFQEDYSYVCQKLYIETLRENIRSVITQFLEFDYRKKQGIFEFFQTLRTQKKNR